MLTKEEKQRVNDLVKLIKENNDDALSELYNIMYREIFLSLKKHMHLNFLYLVVFQL